MAHAALLQRVVALRRCCAYAQHADVCYARARCRQRALAVLRATLFTYAFDGYAAMPPCHVITTVIMMRILLRAYDALCCDVARFAIARCNTPLFYEMVAIITFTHVE